MSLIDTDTWPRVRRRSEAASRMWGLQFRGIYLYKACKVHGVHLCQDWAEVYEMHEGTRPTVGGGQWKSQVIIGPFYRSMYRK